MILKEMTNFSMSFSMWDTLPRIPIWYEFQYEFFLLIFRIFLVVLSSTIFLATFYNFIFCLGYLKCWRLEAWIFIILLFQNISSFLVWMFLVFLLKCCLTCISEMSHLSWQGRKFWIEFFKFDKVIIFCLSLACF